jgi:PAS domain S-box-containing protein
VGFENARNQRSRTSSARGVARYGVALAALVAATAVRWLLDPALGDQLPYVTYFVAVVFVAWFCGLGPSILTLAGGAWLADALFVAPRYDWFPIVDSPQHAARIAAYFVVGASSIAACEAVRRAGRRGIAERERAEEALRHSADALRRQTDQFATLVEHIPDIVARLDRDLRFVYISPSVQEATGTPPDAYIGKPRTNGGIPDAFARERDALSRKAFETGQAQTLVLPIETPSGVRLFETRLIPEFAPDGAVESLMTLTRDVTQLKQAEEALRESNRRKDEFLATQAHELRGPLAPLANMLQILKREGVDADALRQARDVMGRQLGQMTRLVDDLLDVSRISLGKIELRRQRLELASVVRAAMETCRPLADRSGHDVTAELPPEPIHLDGDPVRLAQVLGNLLNNACKFTEPPGRIRLTAARDGDDVVIRVEDAGVGIPRDKLESVFELFTQVNTTLERAHGGLGIGLTLVRRLVKMHGGAVTAHSDGPGRGSQFVVRLPVATSVNGKPTAAGPAASDDERFRTILRRILVVDDNRDAAHSLARLLKLDGHDVHTAHDGEEAVAAARNVNPDLILLDIGLPKLNGYDACRKIRQLAGPRPVVVALTGWGQAEDRQRSRDAGFDVHLVKPVDYQRLTALVNDLDAAAID